MNTLRPWLFVCFALTALLAQACSNDAGTNPFLVGDVSMSDDGSAQDMGDGPCQGCTVGAECFNGDERTRCGTGGNACVACEAGQVCSDSGACIDEPTCTPSNCDGCCDGAGTCQAGTDATFCGAGGLACGVCNAGEACVEGVCRAPCGPSNCAGCCDATGACVGGDIDTSCGTGGAACTDCAGDACSGGQCVSAACADSCAGCCDGSTCIEPTTEAQCGAAGDACVMCPTGSTCDGGMCAIEPTSMWQLFIAGGEVGPTKADGSSWDGFNGLPDPYVTSVIANQTDASTDVEDDTLTPQWDVVLVMGVAAADLTAGFQLVYSDSDAAFDDEICTIDVMLATNDPAFGGGLVESPCPNAALGKVTWRLQPAP